MTDSDTLRLVAEVNARWPHAQIPKATVVVWREELGALTFEQARAGVAAHDRSGERFPPTAGQVLGQVARLGQDLPDWSQVSAEIRGALRKGYSTYRLPPAEWWSSPLVAAFVRDMGWRRFCAQGEDTTFLAQARDAWRSTATRAERDEVLTGLPDAGLAGLRRLAPRPIAAALTEATGATA